MSYHTDYRFADDIARAEYLAHVVEQRDRALGMLVREHAEQIKTERGLTRLNELLAGAESAGLKYITIEAIREMLTPT
jgi:hypothetical protein